MTAATMITTRRDPENAATDNSFSLLPWFIAQQCLSVLIRISIDIWCERDLHGDPPPGAIPDRLDRQLRYAWRARRPGPD
jgi:hypothetical protein